jgi:hypothetical protein
MSHHITENHRIMRRPDSGREWTETMVELDRYIASTVTSHTGNATNVPVDARIVHITTAGAEAMTLPDGNEGQELVLTLIAQAGAATITPTSPADNYATIVLTDVGDTLPITRIILAGVSRTCSTRVPAATYNWRAGLM